jgi:16S rRNA (uracil1498-N3)-methyltransferase
MPYFFQDNLFQDSFSLSSEEAKHITKAMRLKMGDFIWITDGKGTLTKAVLTNVLKDFCTVEIGERIFQDKSKSNLLHLAIAPTKNPDRMEWLVEKAVEIGVNRISFIICERSERKYVDLNRLHRIAISALKQSQGTCLPEIETLPFPQLVSDSKTMHADKFIAYCDEKTQAVLFPNIKYLYEGAVFLVGPEGDFTPSEVRLATAHGFQHISLGNKTLRTETAGLFVMCCYNNLSLFSKEIYRRD